MGKKSTLLRIIPADAGSTNADLEGQAAGRDHPRGCGEHGFHVSFAICDGGSSPRMRGAPKRSGQISIEVGIIPADAGSTSTALTR